MARSGAWGFIGLGEMGEPMVGNLLQAGIPVTVFDRSPERMALARDRGAVVATDVGEVAHTSDVIAICVRDGGQLEAVLADGLEQATRSGAIIVLHSTVGPNTCREIDRRLAARGVSLLDAPVSGMRMAAVAGSLTFFVGGSLEALEQARPGLDAMGERIFHAGEVGAGQAVKLANNAVAFGTVGLLQEALELGRAAGVAEPLLLDALGAGSARSWVIENWSFLRNEWAASQPGGAAAVADIVLKDLELAVETATELGVEASFASVAARRVPPLLGGREA